MNNRRARALRALGRAAKRQHARPAPAPVACAVTRDMRRLDQLTAQLKDAQTPMAEKRELLSYLRGRRNVLFHGSGR